MAKKKWSKQAKNFVRKYRAYKRELSARVARIISKGEAPIGAAPVKYAEYKELYNSALKEKEIKTYSDLNTKLITKQAEAARWGRRYKQYLDKFYKRSDKMISEGLTPYDGIPLKFKNYKELFLEEKNDRSKEIKEGKRSSMGDINSQLISNQLYELSEEQAYAIFDYMKTLSPEEREALDFDTRNINKAIAKIRQGEFVSKGLGLWDIIREERERLFGEGLSKKEVRQRISQTFFGSP